MCVIPHDAKDATRGEGGNAAVVAECVEAWSGGSARCMGWEVVPPVSLVRDLGHDATPAGGAVVALAVHVVDTDTWACVPPVKDTLLRAPKARYLLVLRVRPSPQLVMLVNAGSKRGVTPAYDDATPVTPYEAPTLACARLSHASTTALQPTAARARILAAVEFARDLRGGGAAPSLPAWPHLPPTYDPALMFNSETRSLDWKSAALWLDGACRGTIEVHQNSAIAHKTVEHAAALLNLPGGGELVFGVWDKEPVPGGVEGILCAPRCGGSAASDAEAPMMNRMTEAVANACRAVLHPWRDEWLRVVGVPVPLTADSLLRASHVLPACAAGDVLVATVVDEVALVHLRRALRKYAPCASLPLPLLDGVGALPSSVVGGQVVFRAPIRDESLRELVRVLQLAREGDDAGLTLAAAPAADVTPVLPRLCVVHVGLCATDGALHAAVCTRVDAAVPVPPLVPAGVPRYLPWGDIEARLACESAPWRAALASTLRSGSVRVLCWNVSASRTSAVAYADLASFGTALGWHMADYHATPPVDWAAAEILGLAASAASLQLVLVADDGGNGDDEARTQSALGDALGERGRLTTMLSMARAVDVILVSSTPTRAHHLLCAAPALHAIAAILSAATTVLPRALTRLLNDAVPAHDGVAPPPGALNEAAVAFLRGDALPPDTMLQLLRLPPGCRVDFDRSVGAVVRVAVASAVADVQLRGGCKPVYIMRAHPGAGAATAALRALVDAGCAPLLLRDDGARRAEDIVRWSSSHPAPQLVAVVVRSSCALPLNEIAAALGPRPAVVVTVLDAPRRHSSSVPLVSSQLPGDDLAAGVTTYQRVMPQRESQLAAFWEHARALRDDDFQRSLTALAVSAHLEYFVPVQTLLASYYSAGAPLRDDAMWLALAAVFHACHARIEGGAPRFATAIVAAHRLSPGWHVVGYTPSNQLPLTVREEFAHLVLQHAAVQASGMVPLLERVLPVMVVCDDGDGTAVASAWYALLQVRGKDLKFSNLVEALRVVYSTGAAVRLVDAVRRALLSSRQSAVHGCHLLVTMARLWEAESKAKTYEDAVPLAERALRLSVLAARHWNSTTACTCSGDDDFTIGAGSSLRTTAVTALGSAPHDAFVPRHSIAVMLGRVGVALSRLRSSPATASSRTEPQAYMTAALTAFWGLRGEVETTTAAALVLNRMRKHVAWLVECRSVAPDTRAAYNQWAPVLHLAPGLDDWAAAAPVGAAAATAAASAGGESSSVERLSVSPFERVLRAAEAGKSSGGGGGGAAAAPAGRSGRRSAAGGAGGRLA